MPANPRRLLIPFLSCLVLVTVALSGGPATAATPDYSTIKINEVKTNPNPDFVELINTGSEAVDISGLKVADIDHPAVAFAPGTTLQPGGYFSFDPNTVTGGFGLGAADSVTVFAPDGSTVVDTYAWTTHRTPSYARCTNGTGDFVVTTTATPGAVNNCPAPDPTKVKINEVRTNPNPDFVELLNTGTQPVDISGWKAVDNDPNHVPVPVAPAGTTIKPGAYYSFDPDDAAVTGHFGLGSADSVTVFLADGTTVIDTYSWTAHRTPSYGRCPAGTGDFVATTAATPGALNACPVPPGGANIKINEVESDPGDKVELINTGDSSVDVSGYVLRDESDASRFTVPAGTSIGAHAYLTLDVNASFGLGKGDSARLYAPGGETLLDSTTWPVDTHATTWGRCPDGTGSFTATQPTLGLPNQCAAPQDPRAVVKINEVESNGDKVADWVELTNTGTSTVDVSGWKVLDNDPAHVATPVVVPAGTTIAPGAYYAIYTEVGQNPGFGLGGADSATLYLADGTTQVDSYAWTAHAGQSYGRCPDGTGDFRNTTVSTRGASNACSPVRVNEVESNAPASGPDWVELTNISDAAVDISGWVVKDSTDAGSYTFPAGTSVAAHGYTTVDLGGAFADLGSSDSVRLFSAGGTTLVESYAWTNDATVTFGRCKDGVGDFADTVAATKGAANSCPGLSTDPWPGGQTVTTADLTETFVQDLSGLVFDPADPDILWAAQNKKGTLFKLQRSGQNWVPVTSNSWGAGKDPKYLDGTGAPDTEGLTIGPDGFIYAASERNNSASGVSRMSVLRYDPDATGTTLTATDEWDLTSKIPAAGANLGLEGVAWVPDSYLVGNGFVDQSTGAAYKPSDYPLHGTGLYFVAVEDTGNLHAFALDSSGGTSHQVATVSSGFAHLADVSFDAERQRVVAVTDDTHDGKSSLLKVQGGAFVVDAAYDRPAGMPNLNNEGLAISAQSQCVAGKKEVLWSDDGDTDGHSLRSGTINCTAPAAQTVTFTSTAPGSPVVGETYTAAASGGASGKPVVLSASPSAVCSISGAKVTFDHAGTCKVKADQAAAPGYLAGSATQSVTVGKAATGTTVAVSPTTVTATVAVVAPGVGTPGGEVEFRVGTDVIGTAVLVNGVARLSEVVPSGATRTVKAVYAGGEDFLASVDTVNRRDPSVTATVDPVPASGWYTSPVTVSFACTTTSAPLAAGCPDDVTLSADGAGQTVTRTVTASDGGQATATVTGIGIDRTKPAVSVSGFVADKLYVGSTPTPRCSATDATSGVRSCVITKKVTPTRTTVTAKAIDRAGNMATTSRSYRTLAYTVRGAKYRDGQFVMARGTSYRLDGTVTAAGSVYGPAKVRQDARYSKRLRDGKATVKIPSSATRGSHWKILVKVGSRTYTVKVEVKQK